MKSTTSWTRPCATRTAGRSRSTDEEILARLVALNAERAAEEAQGLVRWLRPEYQAPSDHASRFTQHALIQEDAPVYEVSLETRPLLPWPDRMAEQAQAVRAALVALGGPASAAASRRGVRRRASRSRRRAAGDAGHAGAGARDGQRMVCGVAESLFLARLTRFLLSYHCVRLRHPFSMPTRRPSETWPSSASYNWSKTLWTLSAPGGNL